MSKDKYASSAFMSLKEAAHFFCASRTSITKARGVYAKLVHVQINGRYLVTRESAEKLAADVLKRAKSVDRVVVEMTRRRA